MSLSIWHLCDVESVCFSVFEKFVLDVPCWDCHDVAGAVVSYFSCKVDHSHITVRGFFPGSSVVYAVCRVYKQIGHIIYRLYVVRR